MTWITSFVIFVCYLVCTGVSPVSYYNFVSRLWLFQIQTFRSSKMKYAFSCGFALQSDSKRIHNSTFMDFILFFCFFFSESGRKIVWHKLFDNHLMEGNKFLLSLVCGDQLNLSNCGPNSTIYFCGWSYKYDLYRKYPGRRNWHRICSFLWDVEIYWWTFNEKFSRWWKEFTKKKLKNLTIFTQAFNGNLLEEGFGFFFDVRAGEIHDF